MLAEAIKKTSPRRIKRKQMRQLRQTPKENKERKKQQKQLEFATCGKTLIRMENGLRTLNIASLNPDSMKEKATHQEIIKGLARNKIHLSTIQETHITKDLSYTHWATTGSSQQQQKNTKKQEPSLGELQS